MLLKNTKTTMQVAQSCKNIPDRTPFRALSNIVCSIYWLWNYLTGSFYLHCYIQQL